jgi:hypothetical protein
MTQKIYDRTYYRYKIIEDVPNMGDGTSINNITLHKSKWVMFSTQAHELIEFIRTPNNIKGYVQVQEFNPGDDSVSYDSIKYVSAKMDLPLPYTRDELGLMERSELVEICRYMGIDSSHKTDKYLVKFILDKQKELLIKNEDSENVDKLISKEFENSDKKVKKKKN